MAILRALDGKFYEVPDNEASKYEVPRDKVKELLAKAGGPPPSGQPGPRSGPPGGQVVIQVYPPPGAPHPATYAASHEGERAEVDPYWWWWNNWGNY